jgi:hypothetical protein
MVYPDEWDAHVDECEALRQKILKEHQDMLRSEGDADRAEREVVAPVACALRQPGLPPGLEPRGFPYGW